ncbi:MAG: DUF6596 domain-containing protein, partial [Planctomycetota bacterium]
ENPAGWIHRVARHRLVDALRREDIHDRALSFAQQSFESSESLVDEWLSEAELPNSLLRMMFVSCHPELDRASQIAFTLKTLCGFGVLEISRALLLPKETVKKRLQRARQKLSDLRPPLELPAPDELPSRIEGVHEVLYLLFNEGYSTSRGVDPIRDDLCESGARLCHLLCEHGMGSPSTQALLSLMLFHSSRLKSRVDAEGAPILLEDQDRTTWDHRLIAAAELWFYRASREIDTPTTLHLEAAIARHHSRATSVADTDWASIVGIYDRLLSIHPSPVYTLNRAVARSQAGDSGLALSELDELRGHPDMREYGLVDAARGRILEESDRIGEALQCYRSALENATADHEKQFLASKIAALDGSEG